VSHLAGSNSGLLDGIGTNAQFSGPMGIDLMGDFAFVADANNHLIRKVLVTNGVVSVYAGSSPVLLMELERMLSSIAPPIFQFLRMEVSL